MSARVLPVLALLSSAILYLVDAKTPLQLFFLGISILFLAISITWWWWVMFAIKNIHNNIIISTEKFENIRKDIAELRKEIKKVK